ncbi:SH2 domain-containing protein 4A-like isoform X2 [Watersipora subatra]|uniref:SH2 domain-containing protein 4A-like isoform X2 n=1 Tax=Watersipora subatra TaxID=2589382 RepID=UPI00355BB00D
MLQQIIRDMYIEPDLLAELSEEQKQLIFIKIREEQVRRWKEFEANEGKETSNVALTKKNATSQHVNFLLGVDKNPWVWVMGEHPDDKSIEQIVEEEAKKEANEKAEKEAAIIREKGEREAEQKLREEEKRLELERQEQEKRLAALAAAAKQKEAENARQKETLKTKQEVAKLKFRRPPLCPRHSSDSLHAGNSTRPAPPAHLGLVADTADNQTVEFDGEIFELTSPKERCDPKSCKFCFEEKSEKARLIREESYRVLKEKRTSEILTAFQKTKLLWEKKATEDSQKLDKVWQQREKQAKEADTQRRQLARYAREDYRRNSKLKPGEEVNHRASRQPKTAFRESAILIKNASVAVRQSMSQTKPRPSGKGDIVKWFLEEEKPKNTGLTESGEVEPWFHGMISREEAEGLLSDARECSFLVRVSEKIWGFAISYKAEDRCKHYLIDTSETEGYQFFGTNQLEHATLTALLLYHKNHAISTAGQELLQFPIGQTKTPPDYAIFFPELIESTSL